MGSIVGVVEGMDWRMMEAGGQDDAAQVQHGPLDLRKEILYAKYWSLNVTTEFWNGRK
jgi:hypothetical protein